MSQSASPNKNGPNKNGPYAKGMAVALAQARIAAEKGEVPVGAAILDQDGKLIACAHNMMVTKGDPTAHAELLVIKKAAKLLADKGGGNGRPDIRLSDYDLYVTLEPCTMCAGALSLARIRRLYFGAYDPKGGAVEHGPRFFHSPSCHHAPEVIGGVCEQDSAHLLKAFFKHLR